MFLALAIDDKKALRNFLKDVQFKYHIIPRAEGVMKQFEVSVFPTHIIVNKEGEIETFLTGGSENRHDDLRPLIQRALNERYIKAAFQPQDS